MEKEYIQVVMDLEDVKESYRRYKDNGFEIIVKEKEVWSDCITYNCQYRGCDFIIYDYKDYTEIGYNDLSKEAKKLLSEIDFVIYHREIRGK